MIRKTISFWLVISLALIAVPCVASDVSGSFFYGDITVTNTGTAATNISVPIAGMDAAYFRSSGISNSDLSDCSIRSSAGTDVPFMPAYGSSDWMLFASDLDANSVSHYIFYAKGVTGGTLCYFPGSTGMTVLNNSTIAMANSYNSSWILTGFLNTDAGATKYDVYKPGEFIAYVDDTTAGKLNAGVYTVWPTISASGTSKSSTLATSHTVAIGSPTVGELSIIFVNFYNATGSPTITWPTGYTQIFQKTANNGAGCYQTSGAAYKIATGSEGTNVTITTSAQAVGTFGYYRIANGTYSTLITSGTAATNTSNKPDPPSCAAQYPSAKALYIAISASTYDGTSTASVNAYPANYTSGQITIQDAGNSAIGIASRYLAASSDDPGTFTLSASNPWTAQTICIYPGLAKATVTGIPSGDYQRTYTYITNFLYETSFENSNYSSYWVAGNAATINRTSSEHYYGSYAFKVTANGSTGYQRGQQSFSGYALYKGQTFTLGAWVKAPSTNTGYQYIGLQKASGYLFASSAQIPKDNQWHWVTCTGVLPSDATECTAQFYVSTSTNTGDILYVDGAIMIIGSSLPYYWYNLLIYINGELQGYGSSDSPTIPSSGENYQIGDDDATPYLTEIEFSANSTQLGYWQWEYPDEEASTLTNGTGVATGSPVNLTAGENTVTVTSTGTFTIRNAFGWGCKVVSDTGTVTNSPVWCPSPDTRGTTQDTTITVTGAGTITITLYQVFHDRSAYTNDGMPTFRTTASDADVSAAMITFLPIDEPEAPPFVPNEGDDFITGNITATETPNPVSGSGVLTYPGKGIIDAVAAAGGVPYQIPSTFIAAFGLLALSMLTSFFLRRYSATSLFAKSIVNIAGYGILVALHIFDWWMLIFFFLFEQAIWFGSKHRTE